MPQTKVEFNPADAIKGMIVNTRLFDSFTASNGEADNALNHGDAVYISSFDNYKPVVKKADKTAANTKRIDGFVLYDAKMGGNLKNEDHVAVVRKGVLWVLASWFSGKVDAGSSLVYDLSAGKFVANALNWDVSDTKFVSTATLAAGDIVCPGLILLSGVTAAEATTGTKLLQLEVNLPGGQIGTVA